MLNRAYAMQREGFQRGRSHCTQSQIRNLSLCYLHLCGNHIWPRGVLRFPFVSETIITTLGSERRFRRQTMSLVDTPGCPHTMRAISEAAGQHLLVGGWECECCIEETPAAHTPRASMDYLHSFWKFVFTVPPQDSAEDIKATTRRRTSSWCQHAGADHYSEDSSHHHPVPFSSPYHHRLATPTSRTTCLTARMMAHWTTPSRGSKS